MTIESIELYELIMANWVKWTSNLKTNSTTKLGGWTQNYFIYD